jgi:hypothetical protein
LETLLLLLTCANDPGEVLQDVVIASSDRDQNDANSGWVLIREKHAHIHQQMVHILKSIDSLELQAEKVRVRNGAKTEVKELAAALGIIRNEFWAWNRIPAIFKAVVACPGSWYTRVMLEATIWLITDAIFWTIAILLPIIEPTLGLLNWAARGQSASFRGMLVVLPVLFCLYVVTMIFIEALFFTGNMVYKITCLLKNMLLGKEKRS